MDPSPPPTIPLTDEPPQPTTTTHTSTGEIPASWAALPALRTLSLSYNRLTGPLLSFQSPRLEALLLGGNAFSGHVPALTECHSLQKLLLNGNNLSGRLVRAFCFSLVDWSVIVCWLVGWLLFVGWSVSLLVGYCLVCY